MSIIERSIRYPVTVTVIVLIIAIFGVVALTRVPVQLTPTVDQPVVTISTTWFGRSPQEVMQEVTDEQEDVLKNVAGLRRMSSSTTEGRAQIRLEFGTNVDKTEAMNEVRDVLRRVPVYPPEVDEPIVSATDEMSRDYIAWFIVEKIPGFRPTGPPQPGFDTGDVTSLGKFFSDFVKPVMERAEGVGEVQVLGGLEAEMQVRVDLEKLAARGINIDQLIAALRAENLDVTAGTMTVGKRDESIRVLGQFDSPRQVEETVIAYTRANEPVYVRDVATVVADFKKETGFTRSKAEPVMALNALRETGSNALVVMRNLRAAVDEVNDRVLGPTNWGVRLTQVYDQTQYIESAVENARGDLLLGALLAGGMLFVTLRSFGATIVVMVAIPISVIGTILGMTLLGRSLNVISIAGMTFAVGMAIDNAIVVLENIFRHREMGKDRIRASIDGAKEVWGAIFAATLCNIVVFVPMILIQDEAGQLFRDISVALTISFVFYLLVSPTVIPMLASLLLRRMPPGFEQARQAAGNATLLGRLTSPIGRLEKWLGEGFYNLIHRLTGTWLLRVTMILVLVTIPAAIAVMIMPPREYLPGGNQNFLYGLLITPPGYSMDEYRRLATTVESRLRPWWEAAERPEMLPDLQAGAEQQRQGMIAGVEAQVQAQERTLRDQGRTQAEIDEATIQSRAMLDQLRRASPPPALQEFFFIIYGNFAFMGGSVEEPQRVKDFQLVMNGSVSGIPGTFGFAQQASIFPTAGETGSQISFSVTSQSLADTTAGASALNMALGERFGFDRIRPDPGNFDKGRNETQVRPDKVRAAAAGVGTALRDLVQVAIDGLVVGEYRQPNQMIDLTVVSDVPRADRTEQWLASIPLATRTGVIPLGTIAQFVRTAAPQQINRVDELPAVTFTVPLPQGMTTQEGVKVVVEEMVPALRAAGQLPPSVNLRLEGAADKLNSFTNAFLPGFILAVVITYLVLAALFENWLHPLTIMLSVPLALVGGFVALAALHATDPDVKLDVLTMLGLVILIGTIINNPILIVHQALNNMRDGMPRRRAIAYSTQTRVRPIFMSVVVSIAGMLPLVLGGGAGSELYRGLGAVIIGGLALSTVFTLLLTPMLMSLLVDLQDGAKALLTRRHAVPHAVPATGGDTVPTSVPTAAAPTATGTAVPMAELESVTRSPDDR